MKKLTLFSLVSLVLFSGIFITHLPQATAEDFPSKDIHWIVGGKPGGGVDLYARTVGRYMEKYMPEGVHVIVENRPGAGHIIANNMVYNAEPNGYTLGIPFMPGLYLMQILRNQKYDMKKINWVGTIHRDAQCISISSKSNFKTLDDLKQAEVVRVGIVGPAGEAAVLLSCKTLGIKAKYIAGHKNSKEACLAAIRGDVDIVGFSYNATRKFVSNKQLIPVVLFGSEKRDSRIPDVPTLAELGHPELNKILSFWRLISATPGIPKNRLAYLRDVVWKALHDEELLAWSKKVGRPVDPLTGEETEEMMGLLMTKIAEYKEFFSEFIK